MLVLGGAGAAGWFGYQAYQDEQDANAVRLAETQAADEAPDGDQLTPLGEQVDVIEALEDVNSGAIGGASAGLDAIDDARELADKGDEGDALPPSSTLTVVEVMPPAVVEIGERVPDLSGRETYVVDADEFAGADPAALSQFVRALSNQPQVAPTIAATNGLPEPGPNEYVISIARDGDRLGRALVIGGSNLGLAVDYQP